MTPSPYSIGDGGRSRNRGSPWRRTAISGSIPKASCSATTSAGRRAIQALFIHEMVHVWQHQQGVFLPLARHPFARYDYILRPGKSFARYGIEQQAEIVSHYFLLTTGARLKNGYGVADYEGLLPF